VKKVSLVLFVALLLSGFVGKAQNLSGTWNSPSAGDFEVNQNGNTINYSFVSNGSQVDAGGIVWNSSTAYLTQKVKTSAGCMYRVAITWKINSNSEIVVNWESLSTACGINKGQTGTETLKKQ